MPKSMEIGGTMRSRLPSVMRCVPLLMALCFLLPCAIGCGATPKNTIPTAITPMEKALFTRQTFNNIVQAVNTARVQRVLDDQTFDALNDAYHNVSDLLDELDIAAIKATADQTNIAAKFDYNKAYDAVRKELNGLATQWASARTKSKQVEANNKAKAAGGGGG